MAIMPSSHQLLSIFHLSVFLSISHKLAVDPHTHTHFFRKLSHWHTRQPISGSVEDGCHGSTSRAMLPHDQRCDAAEPACTAACLLLHRNGSCYSANPQMSTYSPQTPCYLVEHRTVTQEIILRDEPFCFALFVLTACHLYVVAMFTPCLVVCNTQGCEQHVVQRCNRSASWITHE